MGGMDMKRLVCCLLSIALALSLCSCGGSNDSAKVTPTPAEATQQQTSEPDENKSGIEPIGDVKVDSGLFDVTLTIPAEFVGEDVTQEDLDKQAKENGYQSITLNDDGSATWVITKAQHKELMDDIRASIEESLAKMIGSEEYPSFVSIDTNDDFTQYKVVLNTESVGMMESIATLGFYMFSGMYHVFNGTEAGNINVQYISEATGDVIEEANSSEAG